MKRKVKKYSEGMLTDSSGNPVRSSSGEPVRTRFGKDKEEDRPKSSGVEDYESLGKRAPAKSTWSGETEIKEEKNEKTDDYESDSVAGKGAENLASESDKDEVSKPAKKKPNKKAQEKKSKSYEDTGAKIGSQSFTMKSSTPEKSSGMGPKNTFLTKERMGVKDKSTGSFMDRIKEHLGNEFKTKKMASGGKVSSASSRGDGIAQRGKTKGRMC